MGEGGAKEDRPDDGPSAGDGPDEASGLSVTELFDRYLRASDGESDEDPLVVVQLAADPVELARRVAIYERMRAGLGEERRLGRFRLLGSLGDGGMSSVHLAFDPLLGRNVALKVLAPMAGLDEKRRQWVLNEARSLARLEHPGIVRIFEVDRTEECDYVVMEHLPGPSLLGVIDDLARRRDGAEIGPEGERLVPFSARLALLIEVGETLAFCHDHGVIHRDVKPGNVLLDGDGHARLIDFGLAHLADPDEDSSLQITQDLRGTPAYLAPEQVEYGRTGADPRSDLFSFTLTAYELLSLSHPFKQETRGATLDAIARTHVPPLRKHDPSLPPDLEVVIRKGLARDPRERYADMAALVLDLRAVLEHRPVQAQTPSLGHQARLWARRNRRIVGLGAAAVLAAGALLATQEFLDVRERHRALDEALAANHRATVSAEEPAEFEAALLEWRRLQLEAEQLDRRSLARLAFPASRPRANTGLEEWSRLMGVAIRERLEESAEVGAVFQFLPWFGLVQRDHDLGLSVGNEDLHARGRVQYLGFDPEEVELSLSYQVVLANTNLCRSFHKLVPTSVQTYQRQGHYRLEGRSKDHGASGGGRLLFQTEYRQAETWGPLLRIHCRPPDPALLARTRAIQGGRPLRDFAGDQDPVGAEFEVAPFRLMTRVVSAREFQRFLDESGEDHELVVSAPDDPAGVRPDGAMAYARWYGGRLPTFLELFHALRSGQIELEAALADTDGEFTADLPQGSEAQGSLRLSYAQTRAGSLGFSPFPYDRTGRPKADKWGEATAFRVALAEL